MASIHKTIAITKWWQGTEEVVVANVGKGFENVVDSGGWTMTSLLLCSPQSNIGDAGGRSGYLETPH